jgi:uncharacterized membrane protein (UPF0182 family)
VVAGLGGTARSTAWIPLTDAGRWGSTLDRLVGVDSTPRETGTVRTPVRVIPLAGKPLYFQSAFRGPPGASPALIRVAAIVGDTARLGSNLASALGLSAVAPGTAGTTPQDTRARLDALYQAMREALRRGDWTRFGAAFDSLGAALRGVPQ